MSNELISTMDETINNVFEWANEYFKENPLIKLDENYNKVEVIKALATLLEARALIENEIKIPYSSALEESSKE